MGILSNSVSICQFRVVGDIPSTDLFSWISGCLQKQAFRSIDQGLEELSTGWVHCNDYQKSAFSVPADFWHDKYIAFTLRQDRRRIPAALFKAYQQVAEHEFLEGHPGYLKVPKQKREEIRDRVRDRLLAKTLPVPSCHDAVWDSEKGIITFCSLGRGVLETFEELFKKTFPALRLSAIHPYARAEGVVEEGLGSALSSANRAATESALDLIVSNRWLGWEFLLWVMYRTMNGSSEYRLCRPGPDEGGRPFTAYIDERLVLCATGDVVQKVTVSGPQDRFSEVRVALAQGKMINEAALHFEKGENRWKMTVKGEMFHFASLKCPKVKEEKGETVDKGLEQEALFFERICLLEEGLQLFDSLLAQFLSLRLAADWGGEAARVDTWLKEDI